MKSPVVEEVVVTKKVIIPGYYKTTGNTVVNVQIKEGRMDWVYLGIGSTMTNSGYCYRQLFDKRDIEEYIQFLTDIKDALE